jgi:anthranilate phosphoribosyltransferase
MAPLVAGVFAVRGTDALVFRGLDGLDELSTTAPAQVWEVRAGQVTEHLLDAVADLGLPARRLEELRGADPAYNAGIARQVLSGAAGAAREIVLLNAAAGIVADGTLEGTAAGSLVERLRAGLEHATRSVDSASAADVLERWRTAST